MSNINYRHAGCAVRNDIPRNVICVVANNLQSRVEQEKQEVQPGSTHYRHLTWIMLPTPRSPNGKES